LTDQLTGTDQLFLRLNLLLLTVVFLPFPTGLIPEPCGPPAAQYLPMTPPTCQ